MRTDRAVKAFPPAAAMVVVRPPVADETGGFAVMLYSRSIVLVAGAIALVGVSRAAHAGGTWLEVGDAGQNGIAEAQIVTGSGTLGMIDGILSFAGNDVDVFQILITDFTTFSAETAGPLDTMLWLFKADGTGQVANDDYTGLGSLSRITDQGVFANGIYYIAVSTFDNQPQDSLNVANFSAAVWPGPDPGQRQPNVAAGAFASWTGDPDPGGGYQIVFTGASYVPAPGSLAAVMACVLVSTSRRRSRH